MPPRALDAAARALAVTERNVGGRVPRLAVEVVLGAVTSFRIVWLIWVTGGTTSVVTGGDGDFLTGVGCCGAAVGATGTSCFGEDCFVGVMTAVPRGDCCRKPVGLCLARSSVGLSRMPPVGAAYTVPSTSRPCRDSTYPDESTNSWYWPGAAAPCIEDMFCWAYARGDCGIVGCGCCC